MLIKKINNLSKKPSYWKTMARITPIESKLELKSKNKNIEKESADRNPTVSIQNISKVKNDQINSF
jgi:hypothetical protein